MSYNKILQAHDLFLLDHKENDATLLYAPLADSCLYVTDEQTEELARACTDYEHAGEEYRDAIDALTEVVPVSRRDGHIRDVKDFVNLSILPNNKCNFSCSYCYSAYGRSTRQLQWKQVEGALQWFFSEQRRPKDGKRLHVTIYGGGEPLLSWDELVRPLFDWLLNQRSHPEAPAFYVTLITNGSLLPDGFIDYCKALNLDLVCSYEILEEVQNSQRKHYALVTENIHTLMSHGIIPAINSVVTPLNVSRQSEMVECVAESLTGVRHLSFEPVLEVVPREERRAFCDSFISHFQQARAMAAASDIKLTCSTLRNVDVTVERYCAGELALVADGSFSLCPCVSSPLEEDYAHYLYGHVSEDGTVSIDVSKMQQLLTHNLHSQTWCSHCFAKWNCGGGCVRKTIQRGMKPDADYCYLMRTFLLHELVNRTNDQSNQTTS